MKKHFFKTFEFEFETTRLLWYTPAGGADFGEVATVAERIKDGDYESWYQEWAGFAKTLEERAKTFISSYSRGAGYFRASRYYQAAEFFLPPNDPRKMNVYQKSVDLFYQALALQDINPIVEILDYRQAKIRTLYFKTEQKSKGTLFVCGGFDALLEELYFTNVKAGLKNGYDVILYEGPGQSDVIRKHKLAFEEKWDIVSKCVVDFYTEKYALTGDKIGIGLSLGGLLLSRAASLDQTLFDKVVLYNYFPSMLDSFKNSLPSVLYRYMDTGFPLLLERICSFYLSKNKFLNWQIEHAKWVFGAHSLNDLLKICAKFDEKIAYEELQTDTLIFLAENENYYDFKLGIHFYEKIPAKNKQLILFNKTGFSSDLHCQNGAAYDANDQLFLWLAKESKPKPA